MRRSSFVILVLVAMPLLLGACTVDTDRSSSAPTPRRAAALVTIADMAFSPSMVEVERAETVAWEWDDGFVPHNVVFDSGTASPQQSDGTWEHRFGQSGTYGYRCTIHPQMTGTVVVS